MRREVDRAAIEIWRFIYTRAWLISPRDGARRNIIAVVNVYAQNHGRKIQAANPLIRHMIHLLDIANPFTRRAVRNAAWSKSSPVRSTKCWTFERAFLTFVSAENLYQPLSPIFSENWKHDSQPISVMDHGQNEWRQQSAFSDILACWSAASPASHWSSARLNKMFS